jgi:hypothetical protein
MSRAWCIRCSQRRPIEPTRFCAVCLKVELASLEQDEDVVLVVELEGAPIEPPTTQDIAIAALHFMYPTPEALRS